MEAAIVESKATKSGEIDKDALRGMRRTAIRALENRKLLWRRHGIGVLQAYVQMGGQIETRIHVWSHRLMLPGITQSGNSHNHRFSMLSNVLVGTLTHDELTLIPDANGTHTTYDFVHAREHTEDTRADMRATGERFKLYRHGHVFYAGDWYSFERGAYHTSMPADDIVVTWVEKYDQRDERACVVAPVDVPPVPAFGGDPVSPALVQSVLSDARARLWAVT